MNIPIKYEHVHKSFGLFQIKFHFEGFRLLPGKAQKTLTVGSFLSIGDLTVGDHSIKLVGKSLRFHFEIIVGLQIHPTLRIGAEEAGKTQGGIGCNCTPAGYDLPDAPLGHANGLGEPVLRDPQGLEEVLEQDLPGMYGRHIAFHDCTSQSVVVHDLDIIGVPVFPPEADAPLVVNLNAPMTFSVSDQFLKHIRRWDTQKLKGRGPVDLGKLSKGGALNRLRKPPRESPSENFLRFCVLERLYHGGLIVAHNVSNVNGDDLVVQQSSPDQGVSSLQSSNHSCPSQDSLPPRPKAGLENATFFFSCGFTAF